MLAALLYGSEDLRLETLPEPTPGPGEVVVKIRTATTCGTDLKVWRRGGHARMLNPPTLFGHEGSGDIVALGEGVTGWRVGDRVVANNSAPCQACFFCQRQEFSLCTSLTFNNGTFAEYLRVPAPIVKQNLLRIPPGLDYDLAALTEPLACVLHGVDRSGIKPGDRVLIIGDGAIGLMFVAALQRQDLDITVMLAGGHDQRLAIGKELGAQVLFNHYQTPDLTQAVTALTEGWGVDVVIEATGIPQVWEQAISCTRPGGIVNLFGGCPRTTSIQVDTERLHYSELTLKGVFHNTPAHVRSALEFLASSQTPFRLLLGEPHSLTDLPLVFEAMRARQVLKVPIYPGHL